MKPGAVSKRLTAMGIIAQQRRKYDYVERQKAIVTAHRLRTIVFAIERAYYTRWPSCCDA